MNLIERAKNIILTPKPEWAVIAGEPVDRQKLIVNYVLILAAIPAVLVLIFSLLVGMFFGGLGILGAIVGFVYNLAMAIAGVFLLGFIVDFLAPTFGSEKNFDQSLKVAAYSFTPVWIASVTLIVPLLGQLIVLAALCYGVYLFYLGLQVVKKTPEEKLVPYTAVSIVVALVVGIVLGTIGAMITGAATLGAAKVGGTGLFGGGAAAVQRQAAKSKLDDFSKQMDAMNKNMEAAQKSGDPAKQAKAAMETLGTVMSGGRKVESLPVDDMKAFVPDRFAGLPKTSSSAERSGVATLMVTTVKATYGDASGKQVRLEVTDAGGAGAMMGLASWMGALNVEKEDDNGAERTRKDGNRIVHERTSKRGGDNEYSVVLAERFIVKSVGSGVDLSTLKGGISGMDLGKLESLKDAGVAKN